MTKGPVLHGKNACIAIQVAANDCFEPLARGEWHAVFSACALTSCTYVRRDQVERPVELLTCCSSCINAANIVITKLNAKQIIAYKSVPTFLITDRLRFLLMESLEFRY